MERYRQKKHFVSRFYTTDFEAMENMDLSINEEELEAICEEFRKGHNRHHFVRNSEFDGAAEKLDPETRELFVDFLKEVVLQNFQVFCFARATKGSKPEPSSCRMFCSYGQR